MQLYYVLYTILCRLHRTTLASAPLSFPPLHMYLYSTTPYYTTPYSTPLHRSTPHPTACHYTLHYTIPHPTARRYTCTTARYYTVIHYAGLDGDAGIRGKPVAAKQGTLKGISRESARYNCDRNGHYCSCYRVHAIGREPSRLISRSHHTIFSYCAALHYDCRSTIALPHGLASGQWDRRAHAAAVGSRVALCRLG